MNKLVPATLVAALLLVGCGEGQRQAAQGQDTAGASLALHALFDEHFERTLEMNPTYATSIGDYRFNDRLANTYSPDYIAAAKAMDEEFLERLIAIDRSALQYQDRLSYDLFMANREMALEGYRFPSHLQPVNQFYSLASSFVQLGSGTGIHPFRTVKDYEDFLSRADDFATNVDQVIANMREGMRSGVVRPRILMQKLLPQLTSQVVERAEASSFFAPVTSMPEAFTAGDRERLTAAYREKIMTTIVPAYQRLGNFIGDEYLAAARETVGQYALPDGEKWYAYLVKRYTTTDMTPEEIHQVGLDEVARIKGEMLEVMKQVGFEGSLDDFFEFVNSDDQFFFGDADDLIQGYRDMTAHVTELSRELFDIFPKTDFEVRRVEPFRERSAAGGSYRAGTADGTRPGVFYANAYDLRARPRWAMEALFLHEAIPGHHFQIMIQRENEALPRFRRYGGISAYSEGWGLYAESLGKELGVFTDPYQYFGGLNAELWRSIRLVVDTGIHARGWTRQQVLDYMYANSAVAEARAVAEAERFMAIPGQALAYKVGQLEIRAIRNKAEAKLGERFDVKAFHREVLEDGAMPLSMLEAKIDRWTEERLAET